MGFIGNLGKSLTDDFGLKNGYQAPLAQTQTSDYQTLINRAMNGQAGPNMDSANLDRGQQLGFINQMQQAANGQGPSLATNYLQNAMNQNNQNAAGMIGSQHGMNPGLQARLILNQNNANNQQAAQQGATARIQEQLAAREGLGNAIQGMRGQDINQTLGANQQNLNALGVAGGLQNSQNQGAIANQSQANSINYGVSTQNQQQQNATTGGLLGTASSLLGGLGLAHGGVVPKIPHYAQGGMISGLFGNLASNIDQANGIKPPSTLNTNADPFGFVKSLFGDIASTASQVMGGMSTMGGSEGGLGDIAGGGGGGGGGGAGALGGMADSGGGGAAVSALALANGGQIPGYASGGIMGTAMKLAPLALMALKQGGAVPGQAKVAGDSPKNDTVPAMLSPKEIVLPRSVTMAEDAPEKAKEFVEALRKKKNPDTEVSGYGKVLESHRKLQERVANLEKLCMGGRS